jgi:ATP synthase protein I
MRSLRPIALPVAGVTLAAAVVAGIVAGIEGSLGALLAGVVVIGFLGSTPLVLTPIVKASALLSLPAALGFFAIKSIAVLVVLVLLFDVAGMGGRIDATAFGITAIVASLTWTVLQVVAYRNQRVPTYDLTNNE